MAGFASILISVLEMCRSGNDLEDFVRGRDPLSRRLVIGCILLLTAFCFSEKHFLIFFLTFVKGPFWPFGTFVYWFPRLPPIAAYPAPHFGVTLDSLVAPNGVSGRTLFAP